MEHSQRQEGDFSLFPNPYFKFYRNTDSTNFCLTSGVNSNVLEYLSLLLSTR